MIKIMEKYLVASAGDTLDSKVAKRFGHSGCKAGDCDGGHGTGIGMGMGQRDGRVMGEERGAGMGSGRIRGERGK